MDKIIYIDCFSGISGDMMLGALIDLGLKKDILIEELKKLPVNGYKIMISRDTENKIACTDFKVEISDSQTSRNYKEIKEIISSSSLKENIKKTAISIFDVLAAAEAKIHSVPADKLHFHEVGATDSIIDIVGTAIGLDYFGLKKIYSAPVPLGSGFVDTAHGRLPVPAPATAEILKGIPAYSGDFDFEVTTPTGAAILRSCADSFCRMPFLNIEKIGYGSGSRKTDKIPNLLRLLLCHENIRKNKDISEIRAGALSEGFDFEEVIILSTNIDDMAPEHIGYITEKILQEKALDVWTEPVFMKKDRQAVQLNILCKSSEEVKLSRMIFEETTTLGIRRTRAGRYFLERKEDFVKLPYGEVGIKLGYLKGEIITCSPEYESCRQLARKTKKPLKDIYRDVGRFFSMR
ncbi:MAG TPA: nickel pincer cofactor biosynthesis protein LarC [Actinobacteria bacterium]|nr:nickel pincer cofactor biosynthesis protein LarC [Actinomycetota bacterium]